MSWISIWPPAHPILLFVIMIMIVTIITINNLQCSQQEFEADKQLL
jgi:hypothetical protein